MHISRLLTVLRARWLAALLTLAAVLAAAAAITWVLPPRYKATSAVLVDMRSPDPVIGTVLGPTLIAGYMTTQMDLLQSQRVVRRAIDTTQLRKDARLHRLWLSDTEAQGDFADWLVERTLKHLDVLPTRDSGVMSIGYSDADPQVAAEVANAVMHAYIDTVLDLRTEPAKRYSDYFDTRAQGAREALERAQSRLAAYQREHGITSTDEALDTESRRLADLQHQLVALQSASAESGGREQLATRNPSSLPEVVDHPSVAGLNAEILRLQARLADLRQRYAEDFMTVREVQQSLAVLREQRDAEMRRVAAGLRAEHQVRRAREERLATLAAQQRDRVVLMKARRSEAALLQQEVDSARLNYEAVAQRSRLSGLESQVTTTNVSVLREARPPLRPAFPNPGANLAIACVLGSLLALAVAMLRELRDRRLRSGDDVVELLRQPLLVVLPSVKLPSAPRLAIGFDAGARVLPLRPSP